MAIEKNLAATTIALGLGATTALAGALERVNLDTSFMYESGTHLELAYGAVTPSIPANWPGGGSSEMTTSMVGSSSAFPAMAMATVTASI